LHAKMWMAGQGQRWKRGGEADCADSALRCCCCCLGIAMGCASVWQRLAWSRRGRGVVEGCCCDVDAEGRKGSSV
jgi:hypothetical protein